MRALITLSIAALLAACGGGGGGSSTPAPVPTPVVVRGSLVSAAAAAPVSISGIPVAKLNPDVFTALLEAGQNGITTITGTPKCAVAPYTVRYNTVGAAAESAEATAAILVPSGSDPACSGPRPVLLYAHATTIDKNFSIADIANQNEARLVAAMFAAQGYLVVAPNYTGYTGSTLAYHPYLVAQAQANDMVDALRAARLSFSAIGATPGSKLFVTGYSQGGHVAVATQRAMQQQYASEFTVTAASGMSGPYALMQMGDAIFGGAPTQGVTTFLPLLTAGGQRAGAALYTSTSDIYENQYASGIDTLLPGSRTLSELVGLGKLPATALFAKDSMPQGAGKAEYFGDANLVKSAYRTAYLSDMAANPCNASAPSPLACSPSNALRKHLKANDLRTYAPSVPLLLCGGDADPTVPYANTASMAAFARAAGAGAVTELNIDSSTTLNDPFRNPKVGFAAAKLALQAAAVKAGGLADQAVAANYHAGLVAPFCIMATRDFFDQK